MIDWGAILAEHGSTVWRTVYRLLDHHADALDCYQKTFLTAFQRAGVGQVPLDGFHGDLGGVSDPVTILHVLVVERLSDWHDPGAILPVRHNVCARPVRNPQAAVPPMAPTYPLPPESYAALLVAEALARNPPLSVRSRSVVRPANRFRYARPALWLASVGEKNAAS